MGKAYLICSICGAKLSGKRKKCPRCNESFVQEPDTERATPSSLRALAARLEGSDLDEVTRGPKKGWGSLLCDG